MSLTVPSSSSSLGPASHPGSTIVPGALGMMLEPHAGDAVFMGPQSVRPQVEVLRRALPAIARDPQALMVAPRRKTPAASRTPKKPRAVGTDGGDRGGSGASRKALSIAEIRGKGYNSKFLGKPVQTNEVIVTETSKWGVWIQDPEAATGPSVSTGTFVYTGGSHEGIEPGDKITVKGRVYNFPNAQQIKGEPDKYSGSLQKSQIGSASWQVVSKGNKLPDAVLISKDGHLPPARVMETTPADRDVHSEGTPFNPATDALAFYTGLRDMRVRIKNPVVVGPDNHGRVVVAIDAGDGIAHRTTQGGVLLTPDGPNTQLVTLDLTHFARGTFPKLAMGDRVEGEIEGVLDYAFGEFRLRVTKPFAVISNPVTTSMPDLPQGENVMRVLQGNLENYKPGDEERFADMIDEARPDMCSFQEVQDDGGTDGSVDSERGMKLLAAAVEKKTGIRYEWAYVSPRDKQDGGQPGGNIRNVFFYNPARFRVRLKPAEAGPEEQGAKLVAGETGDAQSHHLEHNPSRIDPQNSVYRNSRKPLVFEYDFVWKDGEGLEHVERFYHVNIHSLSKRGDESLWGRRQPPESRSEPRRAEQHKPIVSFIQGVLALDTSANVFASGDFNAYQWESSVVMLKGAGLVHLQEEKLDPGEVYTYYFNGQFFLFDHVLASPELAKRTVVAIWHRHAPFKVQASDHDPVMMAVVF